MAAQMPHPEPAGAVAEFLQRWPWFGALPAEQQALVLKTSTELSATTGDYIARVGDPCRHWYGLVSGIMQMYVTSADGAETTLYCQRAGQWSGDGSLLKDEPRRYDLRALTPCHIVLMPAETFQALRRASIEFNQFLCETMNERMGAFVTMLAASRLLGPEHRVARGLMMLTSPTAGDQQELAVSQVELAKICGLSRQRVNMALGQFRRAGLVLGELPKGTLVVDVPRLRAYVIEAD